MCVLYSTLLLLCQAKLVKSGKSTGSPKEVCRKSARTFFSIVTQLIVKCSKIPITCLTQKYAGMSLIQWMVKLSKIKFYQNMKLYRLVFPVLVLGFKSFNVSMYHVLVPT